MKWKLYEELKSKYDNVSMTFGYITKYNRINHGFQGILAPRDLDIITNGN